MELGDLQRRLLDLGQDLGPSGADGVYGRFTRLAILSALTNKSANPVHTQDIEDAAEDVGVNPNVIVALIKTESVGHGFGPEGRPVILYEPHVFSRNSGHRFDASHPHLSSRSWNRRLYARTQMGRYEQLVRAVGLDVDAAFMACSWGMGQVLGENWELCGYISPWAFAWASAQSEGDQLHQMIAFIKGRNIVGHLRRCTADPETCRAFVRAWNGPAYEAHGYHTRFAREIGKAMA